MRHRKKNKTLDRKSASRRALLRGLATNLVLYEKIKTTEAKAKALKPVVEKYITLAKKNDLNTRRRLQTYFYTAGAVQKLLAEIGPRYQKRAGGYLRIVKLNTRAGDNAKMAQIELV